jgi:hypothetical protein
MKTTTNNKRDGQKRKQSVAGIISIFAISLSCLGFACQSAERTVVNVAAPTPSPEKSADDFQERLTSVQTADFDFIFAFRRPDGGVFTSEDKKFLKDNAPRDTNRWDLSADGKTVIAGSNYKFPPERLEALKKRFNVEDYSKTIDQSSNNQNSNSVNSNSVK